MPPLLFSRLLQLKNDRSVIVVIGNNKESIVYKIYDREKYQQWGMAQHRGDLT